MKYTIYIILSIVFFTGCKAKQAAVSNPQQATSSINQVEELITKVRKNQPTFRTANINKMTLELKMGERKVNVSASCKIATDSLIHISVQPFMGIEMFKAEFSRDSIRVFDKMNRRFYVFDYQYLKTKTGLDFSFNSLQSLIFGQYLTLSALTNMAPQGCAVKNTQERDFEIVCESDRLSQNTLISSQFLVKQTEVLDKKSNYRVQMTYSDYLREQDVIYPQNILLTANGNQHQASCLFNILRAEFNNTIKFQSTNPDKYTRSNIDDLLKNIR